MSSSAGADLIESIDYGPLGYSVDVCGIKIISLGEFGSQDAVDKKFVLKIARMVQELFSQKSGIDIGMQLNLKEYLMNSNVIQLVGRESMSSYNVDFSAQDGYDAVVDFYPNTDFIWQLNNETGKGQATEVIEHLLHTVTKFGLPEVYKKEFDYEDSNSIISKAFNEAKMNNVFSIANYFKDPNITELEYNTMLKQEYLYCLMYAKWGLIESHVDGGSLSPEWSDNHLNDKQIQQDNKLGHFLYEQFIAKVLSCPSVEVIDRQFKDFGNGVELYTPDGIIRTGDDVSNYIRGTNGNDVLAGGAGNDTLIGIRGQDVLNGKSGVDELRGGNGRDIITGGAGGDTMYGGFGLNTFEDEADGAVDSLYFKSDQWAENWIYGTSGNSPNGQKADKITELDSFDRIYVQGVETSQLSFGSVNHNSRGETLSGIGIYASGVLEAVYVGDNLNLGQIQAMTQGIL